jgi:hypothetical protein
MSPQSIFSPLGRGRGLTAVAAVFFLAAAVHAKESPASQRSDAAQSSWRMRYPDGEEVVVLLHNEELSLEAVAEKRFAIRLPAVTQLLYRPASWRRSREIKKVMGQTAGLLDNPLCDPGSCPQLVATALAIELILWPFAHGIKTTQHYVEIRWVEDGLEKTVTLRVHKRDIEPVLAKLRRATGMEPEIRPESFQYAQAQKEKDWTDGIQSLRPDPISLELDRRAWVGATELEPGLYHILEFERGDKGPVLCFIREGAWAPFAIVFEVEVEPVGAEAAGPSTGAAYGQERGEAYLREIRLKDRVLRMKQARNRHVLSRPLGDPLVPPVAD